MVTLDNCTMNKFKQPLNPLPEVFNTENWLKYLPATKYLQTQWLLICAKTTFTPVHFDAGTMSIQFMASGKKMFLLAPPNAKFLHKQVRKNRCEFRFCPSELEGAMILELEAGDIFNIPPGYAHGVYTSEASICFSQEVVNCYNYVACKFSSLHENNTRAPHSWFNRIRLVIPMLGFKTISNELTVDGLPTYMEITKDILEVLRHERKRRLLKKGFDELEVEFKTTEDEIINTTLVRIQQLVPGTIVNNYGSRN